MSVMGVSGVAFDLEGTLIDLEQVHWQSELEAAAQAGLSLSHEQALAELPHYVGGPKEKLAEDVAALLGESHRAHEVFRVMNSIFLQRLKEAGSIAPRPGVLDFLGYLRQQHIPCAIGSVTDREVGWYLLHASGLDAWFVPERVVFKEAVARLKPAPDVYLKTAQSLGIAPNRQLVFEDSTNGVRAAVAAGSTAVAVPVVKTGFFNQRLRDAGAVLVLDEWSQWQRATSVMTHGLAAHAKAVCMNEHKS